MAHHACVTCLLGHLNGIQRLGQAADLVDLDEDGVRATKLDALRQTLGVRDEQVVAHQLHLVADAVGQLLPAVPVLLGHAVLDGDDRILLDQRGPVVHHLGAGQLATLALQLVLAGFGVIELGGSRVHGEHDVVAGLVASRLASLHDVLQRLFVGGEVGGETALVADAAAQAGLVQNLLQGVVDLGAPAQRLGERLGAHRHDHELLEVDVVVGMHAAVEDVHHRRGQDMAVHAANILVQRKTGGLGSGLGAGQGHAQDGVSAQSALVVRAVQLQHHVVDGALIVGLEADERIGDLVIHMANGIQRALAQITLLVAVAQLHGLERARGRAGGNGRTTEGTILQHNFHLDRGVAARVQDFTPEHIDDDAH